MATVAREHELITATEDERSVLTRIEGLLDGQAQQPRLVGPNDEVIPLPPSLVRLLQQSVPLLMESRAVTVLPYNEELTTQQAADLLNVSRPYLIKLLDQGEVPFTRVGTHRRIRFGDLLDYKRRRDAVRRQALADLTRMSRDLGLLDE